MGINVPLKDLGEADTSALQELVLSIAPEAWSDNSYRQKAYDVHTYTQSLVMVLTTGEGWPDIEVSNEAGWDLLEAAAPPLMHSTLVPHYPPGGTIIRVNGIYDLYRSALK